MTDHDVAAAARILGVTERTVRRWLREGRLAAVKVGGRVRISDTAIREAVAPYGSGSADAAGGTEPTGSARPVDPLMAWLTDPVRRAEARRLRLEAAARAMDEIRARSKPPSGPHDTAEALVRAVRDEQDARWDERLGLDRS
jgi:excisionase family DNA binding protein